MREEQETWWTLRTAPPSFTRVLLVCAAHRPLAFTHVWWGNKLYHLKYPPHFPPPWSLSGCVFQVRVSNPQSWCGCVGGGGGRGCTISGWIYCYVTTFPGLSGPFHGGVFFFLTTKVLKLSERCCCPRSAKKTKEICHSLLIPLKWLRPPSCTVLHLRPFSACPPPLPPPFSSL